MSSVSSEQTRELLEIIEAIDYLDVDKVTLTGICGGIDKEMNYGDIIISNQIVDYELDKM